MCSAAVHAGLITLASGGKVTIRILPGRPAYTASTRHGVTSNSYGSWSGSYAFVVAPKAPAGPILDGGRTWASTAAAFAAKGVKNGVVSQAAATERASFTFTQP